MNNGMMIQWDMIGGKGGETNVIHNVRREDGDKRD